MTKRDKIIETLKQTSDIWKEEERHGYIVSVDLEKIADALIAAGIGDVKEADRRAEVAERALKDMCEEYEDNFECDLYKECNSDKPCYLCDYKVRLQKAAREIEEGKGK